MYVTSSEQRAGLLVAVITGGRLTLKERPVARFLENLKPLGVEDIVWVVSEADSKVYEPDEHPFAVYPKDWMDEYVRTHWTDIQLPVDKAVRLGPFAGREWACLEAERRGCWGVLQLDDNIVRLRVARGAGPCEKIAMARGGMGFFADLIAAVALSTNAWMVGSNLDAVPKEEPILARAGFPYSLFIERVGPGREHWYGPFEDDIIHGFQYGTRADGATAALLPALRYAKESKSKTGLRAIYNHSRAAQLQRMFPESAKIVVKKKKSNGKGGPRVFHHMNQGAIRNPLRITDPELYGRARDLLGEVIAEWYAAQAESNRAKIARRVAKLETPV